MPSWGIVSTVRAPRYQCEIFAKHYLSLGAARVTLFHDDPKFACPFDMEGVKHIICDDEYWKDRRPDGLEMRQRKNATVEMRFRSVDWLMHCDIDELCYCERGIGNVLDDVDEDVGGLMVESVELVYSEEPTRDTLFATCFFKAFRSRDGKEKVYLNASKEAFGDIWAASKAGFWGHVQGKSFIRTSSNSGFMPLHHKQDDVPGYRMRVRTKEIALRHYDTLTYDLWREKHFRRIDGSVSVPQAGKFRFRQQQLIKEALALGGEDSLKHLYNRMTVLPPHKMIAAIEADFVRVLQPEAHLLENTPGV